MACRATAQLIRNGKPTVSPIVHSHPLVKFGLANRLGISGTRRDQIADELLSGDRRAATRRLAGEPWRAGRDRLGD